MYLFYRQRHSTQKHFLDMNNTVEEADLDNTHLWIQASWTDNRFYANNIPIFREDNLGDSSNGRTNVSDSSEEAKFPE